MGLNIAVVGATGQVGSVMRRLLEERDFPVASIRYFASSRSAGTTLPWKGTDVVVEDVDSAVTAVHTAFELDAKETEAVVYGGTGR